MPELPDVETFRSYIDATALHKRVERATDVDTDLLVGTAAASLKRRLSDATLERTQRHGKYLGLQLDAGAWLVLHFGMTGYPEYAKRNGDPPQHTRLLLQFDNGYHLAYVNQRKLGQVRIVADFAQFVADEKLGPDALAIEQDAFVDLLADGRGTLKTRLMNQNLIAGLGNVYVDEICFQAQLHPGVGVADLGDDDATELWRTMRHVLRSAVKRRANPEEFPDGWLTRHRGEAECPRCGGPLEQTRIGGRTTHYCPQCQPAP